MAGLAIDRGIDLRRVDEVVFVQPANGVGMDFNLAPAITKADIRMMVLLLGDITGTIGDGLGLGEVLDPE